MRICSFAAAGRVFSVKTSSFGTSYFDKSIGNVLKPASAIDSIAFVGVKTAYSASKCLAGTESNAFRMDDSINKNTCLKGSPGVNLSMGNFNSLKDQPAERKELAEMTIQSYYYPMHDGL